MDAAPYDLALVQGATFNRTFQWLIDTVAQPLGAYTIKSQIRQKEDTTSLLILDLAQYMSLSGGDTIVLKIPAQVVAALNPKLFRHAAWDLFLVETADDTNAFPLVAGAVTCDPAATDTVVVIP